MLSHGLSKKSRLVDGPFFIFFSIFSYGWDSWNTSTVMAAFATFWKPHQARILFGPDIIVFFECADSVSFDVWKPWLKKRYSPLLRGSVQVHDPNTQRNSNMVFVHSVIPHCWAGLPYTPYRLLPRTIPGSMFTVREKFLRDEVSCMYIFCTTTSSRNKSQQQIILYRVSSSSLK